MELNGRNQTNNTKNPEVGFLPQTEPPRSLAIAQAGINTSQQFAELMSCLMSDIIDNRVSPSVANATVNAGGKLLKMVELEYKYGTIRAGDGKKSIDLLQ